MEAQLTPQQAEHVAIFAARRATYAGQIDKALHGCLKQLTQSKNRAISDHAGKLAIRAIEYLHASRKGGAA